MLSKSAYRYDETTKILSAPGPEFKTYAGGLGKYYFDNLNKWADKILQIDIGTGEEDSAQDLLTRSIKTALYMKDNGIKPGDIISTCSYLHINAPVPIIAAQMIGAIDASTDPFISLDDTIYMLNLVKPKMFFVADSSVNLIQEAVKALNIDGKIIAFHSHPDLEEFSDIMEKYSEDDVKAFVPYEAPDSDATCVITFSSGTTGKPKGICLSHNYYLVAIIDIIGTNVFSYGSYNWNGCMLTLNHSIGLGLKMLLKKTIDPNKYWADIDKYKVDMVRIPPVFHLESIKSWKKGCGKSLLCVLIVGNNLRKEDYINATKYYPNAHIMTVYCLTETGVVSSFRNGDNFGSVGTLDLNNQIVKITDSETEETLSLNKTGEIRVKRKYQMNGYFQQDSSDCWDKDGFLKTGDLGYLDDDFNLYVVDRIKETFRYRAYNVIPFKIEDILMQHPNVRHAVAIGAAHKVDNYHPMGIVVLKDPKINSTAEEIATFANERLDNIHKIRAGIRIVTMEDIPDTPSGKINRKKLRETYVNVYNIESS